MKNIEDINDFPKLVPDKSIRFELKSKLKFDEIEFEELENKLKLRPDTSIVMPKKESLKHNNKVYFAWISVAVAAAIAFILLMPQSKQIQIPDDAPSTQIATTISEPEKSIVMPKIETNQNEIKPEKVLAQKTISVKENKPISIDIPVIEPEKTTNSEELMLSAINIAYVNLKNKDIDIQPIPANETGGKTIVITIPDLSEKIANLEHTEAAKKIKAFFDNRNSREILVQVTFPRNKKENKSNKINI